MYVNLLKQLLTGNDVSSNQSYRFNIVDYLKRSTLFLVFGFLLFYSNNLTAQVLQVGDAVISCAPPSIGTQTTVAVKRIQSVGTLYQNPANYGSDQSSNIAEGMSWTTADFSGSEIFATVIDQETGTIYAAASVLYLGITETDSARIFQIDATTGAVSVLSVLPGNRGLGYLDIDPTHNQLLTVNIDNGMIHRVDNTTGALLGSFDPLNADTSAFTIAPVGERLLGISYNTKENRVYYSVWATDNFATGNPNTIRSVALDATGAFLPATDQLEITLPYRTTAPTYSMPVGDIAFNYDYTSVLLAETGFDSDPLGPPSSAPHKARVLKYDGGSGSWTQDNNIPTGNDQKYDIGDVNGHENSRGGVAWAYETVDSSAVGQALNITEECEEYILLTGDALLGIPTGPPGVIYGLQFTDVDGGNSTGSIVADMDYEITATDKSIYGDVDIYKGSSANLGSYLWIDANADGIQDSGESPLTGISLNLYIASGAGYTLVGTTTTDSEGEYYFDDNNVNLNGATGLLADTNYFVVLEDASFNTGTQWLNFSGTNYELTELNIGSGARPDKNDSDGILATAGFPFVAYPYISFTTNNFTRPFDHSLDFGFKLLQGDIGDFVWLDTDGNGVQDGGEIGIENVMVIRYNADTSTPIDTVYTDNAGAYTFVNPAAGNYYLVFDPSGNVDGYTSLFASPDGMGTTATDSDPDPATGQTATFSFDPTSGDDLLIDAGFYEGATLSGFVWTDLNNNGQQDVGENGFSGIDVILYDSITNLPIDTITTTATGIYSFTGIDINTYYIVFDTATVSAKYQGSPQDIGADNSDSDADPISGRTINFTPSPGQTISNIDAGFFAPASIGNFVWEDLNYNGIQDGGETGILGVEVVLYDALTDTPLDTMITDALGMYEFTDLLPADYYLYFDTSTGPTNAILSLQGQGTTSTDSDPDPATGNTATISLMEGESNQTLDAGLYVPASIGGLAWNDLNNNGQQDGGELGLGNINVILYDNGTGLPIDTMTTDGLGAYQFDYLGPASYYLVFDPTTIPLGYQGVQQNQGNDTTDSDADPITGQTANYILSTGINLTNEDAGFFAASTIGNLVWDDTDFDGQFDLGEPGLVGIDVIRYDALTDTPIDTVSSIAGGFYQFTNVIPGTYYLIFDPASLPLNYIGTLQDQGADISDSDADPTTGRTADIVVNAGSTNDIWDAGFINCTPVDAGIDMTICSGDTIALNATNGGNYSWTPTGSLSCSSCSSPNAFPVTTTKYYLTSTAGAGCVTTDSVTITVMQSPDLDTVVVTQPTSCIADNGVITISVNGSGLFEYSIDGGGFWNPNSISSNLAPGSYTIMARSFGGGCEETYALNPVILNTPSGPSIDNVSSTGPTTCGGADGTITITASGGSGTYQYSIDAGTSFQASNLFTGLVSGTYNIEVEDTGTGCSSTNPPIVLTDAPQPSIDLVTSTDPTNCGASDGTITITASGGSGSYEYSIDNGGTWVTGGNFIGLPANSYNVLIRNDDGSCEVAYTSNPVILTEPTPPVITAVTSNDPSNCALGDGTITITASSGSGSYEYSIDNGGTWVTTNNFTGLSANSYNVLVRNDDGTCEVAYASNPVVLTEPTPPVIDMVTSTDPTNCGSGDGTITITASSGSGSYEYSIDNGGTWVTGGNFIGLSANSYTIVVRNDNGTCEVAYASNPVVLTEPTSPVIDMVMSTNPTNCGTSDGTITITASSGTGSYEYSIDNGGTWVTGGNFIGLSANSYTVLVRNDDGTCEVLYGSNPVTLTEPASPVIDLVTSTDPSNCGTSDGTITITASSGSGSYEYSIDNGGTWVTGGNFIGLSGNSYTILVRNDDGSCEVIYGSNPVVLTEPTAPIIDMVTSTNPTNCGSGDGTITIVASSGSGSYEYSIDNGGTWVTGGNFIGLSANSYTIVVRNDDGTCEVAYASNPVVLTEPTPPVIDMVTSTDPSSCGASDGTITITASSGTGSYEYSIDNGGTWVTGGNFIGLSANSYTVLVRNDDGTCEVLYGSNPVTLTEPAPPVIDMVTSTDPTNCGSGDGTITITASSGSGSYEYSIDNGGTWVTGGNFIGLSANSYTVLVRNDDGSCEVAYASNPVVLTEPTAPVIDMVTSTDPTNCGSGDGTITITASSGSGSYEYSIDNGGTWVTSSNFIGLPANSYIVLVRNDDGSCEITYASNPVVLTEPTAPVIDMVTSTDPTNCGSGDGTITVTASGGSGSYEYSIDNGGTWVTGGNFIGLSANSYTILVRNDDGSCEVAYASNPVVLTEPTAPVIDMVTSTDPTNCGSGDGTITITASSGSGSYEYSIDNGGTWVTGGNFIGLSANSYTILVRNDDGSCEVAYASNPVILTPPNMPVIDMVTSTDPTNCGSGDGTITVTASGGSGSYEYSIDNGGTWVTGGNFIGLSANSYTVLVRNDDGSCEVAYASNPVVLTEPTAPVIDMVTSTDPTNCGSGDGTITITASGGSGSYEYSIDNGGTWITGANFIGLLSNSYTILVRNDDGSCEVAYASNPVVLTEPTAPVIDMVTSTDPTNCGSGDGTITITASGGSGSYEYSIDNGGTWVTGGNFIGLSANSYTVLVRNDDGSCEVAYASNPVTLTPPNAPVIDMVTSTDPTNCGSGDGTITVTASGGSGSYEYSIDNGGTWVTGGNFISLSANSYTILVRNDDGSCEVAYANNPVILTEPTAPVIDMVTSTDPTNCGSGDGTITITASGGSGSYEYSVDNGGTWVTGGNFIGLLAGSYMVLVRNDDGSCEVSYASNPVILSPPNMPVIDMVTSTDPSSCGAGDGSITITASGGTGSYEYSIDNGGTWVTGGNFIGLSSGSYMVLVRNDDGSCETTYASNPVVLTGPLEPSIDLVDSSNLTDCGSTDGTITITASGGTGNLEYSIDNGATWQTGNIFNSLAAGTYNIQVRNDDGSCPVSYAMNPLNLTEPIGPTIDAVNSTDPTDCNVSDGIITITASGGSGTYEYSVDNGTTWQTGNTFNGLASGSYTVLLRNDDGTCAEAYINNPVLLGGPGTPGITIGTLINPSCGFDNGEISIIASGGSGSYEYSIDNGVTWQTSDSFTGLGIGTYMTAVRNDDGTCPAFGASLNLTELPAPIIDMVMPINPSDCGIDDGSISITASGGIGFYEYSIDNGVTWQGNNSFSNLMEGSFDIWIRNLDDSCPIAYVSNPVVISAGIPPVIDLVDATDLTDCGTDDGTITITASGGNGAYEYSIDNGVTWQTTNAFTNLVANSYTVLVRNDNGSCAVSYVNNPVVIIGYTAPSITSVNATDPTDCTINDGSINIVATAGSGNLEYSIDNGLNWSATGTFNTLASGNYEVLVRNDDGSCVQVYANNPVILFVPGLPTVSSTVVDASSCGEYGGAINLTVSGGTNFSYNWTGPNSFTSANQNVENLEAGTYDVTVTNTDNSCPRVENIIVGQGGLAICRDTSEITIPIINAVDICLDDLVNLPGNIISASVCADDPATVTVSVDVLNNCIKLDPNDSFIGVDTICVIHCDDTTPQYCDTNYVIVNIEIPIDTIPFVIGQDDPVDVCLDNTTLQLQGTITSTSFCNTGNAATVLATAVLDTCVSLDPADGYFGTSPDLICVVHCYDNNPSLCDTTYLEISVLPALDTITLTIPADVTTEICLDATVLENTGIISSTSICDTGNSLTVEATAVNANCVSFSPAIGFDGLSSDTICVVHCYDNIPGFCDTTYIIVDVMRDPCDFIIEQVVNQTLGDCSDLANVCFDISLGNLGNYNITDNGVAYSGSTVACFDTLYNYNFTALTTATGPFTVSDWTVDGQSFSGAFTTVTELVALMNTWNPQGNWTEDNINNAIIGGTPLMTYSDITITTSGAPIVLMRQTFLAPGGTSFSFNVGTHEVIFDEIATGCQDTVQINVSCNPCIDLYTGPDYMAVMDCDTIVELCVNIDQANLADYTITDNGVAYAGNFTPCGTVNMIDGYNAASIPDAGANGPYFAEWVFNGSTFTTSVMTIQEIVNAMNTWDPMGNWILNLPTLVISGGDNMNTYGNLRVNQTNTGAEVILTVESLPINLPDAMSLALNSGTHELIFSNTVTGCLDTINFEIDCNSCSILDPGPFTIYTTECDELVPYCLDITLADLFNYSITDNGTSYSNGIAGCDYDSLIVYQYNLIPGLGAAGPYTLDYWVVNGDSIMSSFTDLQALVDSMNIWDSNGNWMINTGTFTIEGGDFTQNYGDMSVTQVSSGINAFVALGLGLVPQGSMISLDTGYHQVMVTDLNTGCMNPIDITVECIEITPTIFGSTVFVNAEDEYCLDTLELPGTIISVENVCDDQLNGNAGFVIDPITLCVTYQGLLIGADTACMVICDDNGLCDTTYLLVNVVENCPEVFTMQLDTLFTGNCNDTLAYCLLIDSLENYTFTDNGAPFSGGQEPCNFVDEVFYDYTALSGFGNAGPYTLNQWVLNGVTISAQFDSIHMLVDSMNVWDSPSVWVLDSVNLIISGGNASTTYGVLEITQNSSGQNSVLPADVRSVGQNTAFLFGTGMHELIVTDTASGCMDTLNLFVNCPFPDILYDTIQVGQIDTLCMDVSALTGTIDTIYNDCPDNPGEFALIDVLDDGSYCISYEAVEIGEETACIIVCDENICDTTTVFITVIDTTIVMGGITANPDNDTTLQNIPITLQVIQNDEFDSLDTIYILTPPNNGTAVVTPDGVDILYTPNSGYCDSQFPDVLDYVICNQTGCDTTFAAIFVLCSDLEIFTGFSPNGDDVNDRFMIEGVSNYPNNTLCVFNRWGNQVHLEKEYNNTWEGTWEGTDLPDGTYFYMFDTGEGEIFTGYVQIHR